MRWRQLARGLRALTRRDAVDREIAEEIDHYVEEAAAAHVARGLSPEAARRAARAEIGSAAAVRDEVRASGWERAIEEPIADLRYGARRLVAHRGFTSVTALTLALGIGASTAMFSAAKPILIEPLPYPGARRIVTLWDHGLDGARLEVTFGTYRELVERSQSFEAIAVMRPWQPTVTGAAEPERLDGQRVTAAYFRVLGVPPIVGRDFEPSDDALGAPRVAIVSDALWRRRFGADPEVVGQRVVLDGDPYTIVGVMPGGFENVLAPSAAIWRPLQYDATLPSLEGREWGHHLRMVARLSAGTGAQQARADIERISRNPIPEFARPRWASLDQGLLLDPLQDDVTRGVRPALLAVAGAVALLLAIACVNVTSLLLGRGVQRRDELAMRAALGASRGRLIRQMLTETLLLALIGGALGSLVARVGLQSLLAFSPPGLPRADAIAVDGAAFAFAFVVTMIAGVVVGLVPALHASRGDLRGTTQGTRQTIGHQTTRRALVVAQVALALVLLVSAGLLLRSLQTLFAIPPGFDADGLLTMQVQTSGRRFDDDNVTRRFFADALEAVRQVPGVAAAALTSQLPLSGDYDLYGIHFESSPSRDTDDDRGGFRYAVSPGYFEAMGIPIRQGRALDERDTAGAPLAVVIGESFARRRFPGRDPIGERLHIGPNSGPWFTIVGVAGDVKQMSLALNRVDAVYVTPEQWRFADRALWLVVRARGDAAALAPAIRSAIWSVDKDQPVVRVGLMSALLAASAADRRFALAVFEAFGLAALALAATGIYGVLAGSVTERRREIGVRAALGASRRSIVGLILGQGLTLTGLGIVTGLAGAAAASGAIAALLFGVSRLDPITYAAVLVLLLGVASIACAIPAWRASRVDPVVALRE